MGSKLDIRSFAKTLRSKLEDSDDIVANINDLETSWNNGDNEKVKTLARKLYADILEDAITAAQRLCLKDMMDGKRKPEEKMKTPNTETDPHAETKVLGGKGRNMKTLEAENGTLQSEKDQVLKKVDDLKETIETKYSELESLKETIKIKDSEFESLTENIRTIDSELESLKEKIKIKDLELESLKETIKAKDSELEKLKEEIKAVQESGERVLKRMEKEAESDFRKLEKEKETLQTAFDMFTDRAEKALTKLESEKEFKIHLKEKNKRLQTDLTLNAEKALTKLESEKECKSHLNKESKRLQTDLDKATDRVGNLELEINRNNLKLERSETSFQQSQEQNDESFTSGERVLKRMEKEAESDFRKLEKEKETLQTALDMFTDRAEKALTKLESEKECKIHLKEKNKRLQTDLGKATDRIGDLQLEINRNNLELERSKTSLQESQERNDELTTRIYNMQLEINQNNLKMEKFESSLQESQERKDELATRLSRAVGEKLTYDNPHIVDLSDGTRPTKLAEKYSELYDNEWAEAYESLYKLENRTDEEMASFLRKILLDCYDVCMKTADVQMQHIKSLILHPSSNGETVGGEEELKFSEGQENMLTNLRKETADRSHTTLVKVILKKHREAVKSDAMVKFIKTCTCLCWKMAIQTPPVFIDPVDRRDELFDKNIFNAYTRLGEHIELVVWPPLYLHENGQLLSKGIAQGKKGNGK